MPIALSKDLRELVKQLVIQGLTKDAIVARTGVKPNTLTTWIARGNWVSLRRTVEHHLEKPGNALLAVEVGKASADKSKAAREAIADEVNDQLRVLRQKPAKSGKDLANTKQRQGRSAVLKTLAETAKLVHGWEAGQSVLINIQHGAVEPEVDGAIDVETTSNNSV